MTPPVIIVSSNCPEDMLQVSSSCSFKGADSNANHFCLINLLQIASDPEQMLSWSSCQLLVGT